MKMKQSKIKNYWSKFDNLMLFIGMLSYWIH